MKLLIAFLLLIGIMSAQPPTPRPSDAELAARVLIAINEARVKNGFAPYALNPLLTQAAQAHSEYQMERREISHTGPGEMTALDRVAETGYPFIRVNENIYGGGMSSPEDAVEWWLTADELHNRNVLHPDMREAGIGAATSPEGWTYYTLDISSQPNVLPIFINSDDYTTTFPDVVITLTNETMFTGGGNRISYAIQVMLSNSADFAGATVLPWSAFLNWTLDISSGAGTKTVYVRYIDAAGRTADAQDSIVFDPHGTLSATSDASPTLTPTPTIIPTVEPTVTESQVALGSATPPTAIANLPTAPPIIETVLVPVPAPQDSMHTIRTLFAGILLGAILTIIVGILVLMRRLHA